MTNRVGLWIDHKKAIVVSLNDRGETVKKIESGAKHIEWRARGRRRAPDGAQHAQAEDQLDNQFMEQLKKYYDEVALLVRDATDIFIFGPREARTEFRARLAKEKGPRRHIEVKPADKMTDRQIVALVRDHFNPNRRAKTPT